MSPVASSYVLDMIAESMNGYTLYVYSFASHYVDPHIIEDTLNLNTGVHVGFRLAI